MDPDVELMFEESNEKENRYALSLGGPGKELMTALCEFYGGSARHLVASTDNDWFEFEAFDRWHGRGRGDLRELADEFIDIFGQFFSETVTVRWIHEHAGERGVGAKIFKPIEIPEHDVVEKLNQWISEADGDELARVVGDLFGGNCVYVEEGRFQFTPSDDYYGAFGEAETKPEEEGHPLLDTRLSFREGWGLFSVDSTDMVEIQRDDESEKIDSDEEAVKYVRAKAEAGSDYHRKAIEIHDKHVEDLEVHRGHRCRKCHAPDADNGEGWDGMCGNCADEEDRRG